MTRLEALAYINGLFDMVETERVTSGDESQRLWADYAELMDALGFTRDERLAMWAERRGDPPGNR